MRDRPAARAVRLAAGAAAGAVAAAALAVGLTSGACTTHQCDFSFLDHADGHMVGPDTWESGPFDGEWLAYPGQRKVALTIPEAAGRTILSVEPYVSVGSRPFLRGDDYTVASGDLAKITWDGRINLQNATCADFYLRVVVRYAPQPNALTVDGGDASTDAGAPDSPGADASTDAPLEGTVGAE